MQKLLIATSNKGKLAEYRSQLKDLAVELVSLADLNLSSVEETGETFEENALLKAKSYFAQSGLPCIADDGGIEIAYLNNEPGVRSRRWKTGDESASDQELVEFTLEKMRGVPQEKRAAHMRLVMAFIDKAGEVHMSEAAIEGVIAEAQSAHPREGLPFRAVLYIPQFKKMWDDLTQEEDAAVNQRIAAINVLKPVIKQKLS